MNDALVLTALVGDPPDSDHLLGYAVSSPRGDRTSDPSAALPSPLPLGLRVLRKPSKKLRLLLGGLDGVPSSLSDIPSFLPKVWVGRVEWAEGVGGGGGLVGLLMLPLLILCVLLVTLRLSGEHTITVMQIKINILSCLCSQHSYTSSHKKI